MDDRGGIISSLNYGIVYYYPVFQICLDMIETMQRLEKIQRSSALILHGHLFEVCVVGSGRATQNNIHSDSTFRTLLLVGFTKSSLN